MKFLIILLSTWMVCHGKVLASLEGKIVGGEDVTIEAFPYMASVRIFGQHICGGTIIDEETILTSAHCVYAMNQNRFWVSVGNTNHNLGTLLPVKQVIQHYMYNLYSHKFDMALLKLKTKLVFSDKIQKIPLQKPNLPVPAGTVAWVAGWGTNSEIEQGITSITDNLRAVNVTVIDKEECSTKYGPGLILDTMMCAQSLNKDACQGDSGGPLVANRKLIAVVSWGYGCARPEFPGVYSSVAEMYNWIETHRQRKKNNNIFILNNKPKWWNF